MGGYTDEEMVKGEPSLDTTIAELKKIIQDQAAYDVSAEVPLGEKYNQLYDIVMEASDLATANGWFQDEAFSAEQEGVLAALEETKHDLENPDSMEEAYMNELSAAFDVLITLWQGYLTQVSEPYYSN